MKNFLGHLSLEKQRRFLLVFFLLFIVLCTVSIFLTYPHLSDRRIDIQLDGETDGEIFFESAGCTNTRDTTLQLLDAKDTIPLIK